MGVRHSIPVTVAFASSHVPSNVELVRQASPQCTYVPYVTTSVVVSF